MFSLSGTDSQRIMAIRNGDFLNHQIFCTGSLKEVPCFRIRLITRMASTREVHV